MKLSVDMQKNRLVYADMKDSASHVPAIALTEKGQSAINQTWKLFACIDNAMVQGFDDAELDALMNALSRIEQNLHSMLEQTQTTHGKEDTL